MRDSSLHIKRSSLVRVLMKMGYAEAGCKVMADAIIHEAQPYQITDRYKKILEIDINSKRSIFKDMTASLSLPDNGVEVFNRLLNSERQKRQPYIRLRPITKSSKDYTLLKEVAVGAWTFVDTFDISPKSDGVLEYIKMGLDYMGKYSLGRFKYYHSHICEAFENLAHVSHDPSPEVTNAFYEAWQEAMLGSGASEDMVDIKKDLNKYVHFVYAAAEAKSVDADAATWIEAQFEGLSFLNVIPELYQLYGVNAKKRYDHFLLSAEEPEEGTLITKNYKDDNDD